MNKLREKFRTEVFSLLVCMPALTFYCWPLFANPIDEKAPNLVYGGAPVSSIHGYDQYLIRTTYALHYFYGTKTAEYVCEHITKKAISGPANRKNVNFHPDMEVPDSVRAKVSDYTNTGYDKGHLDPAADNTQSAKVMSECFLLSNIVPQNPNNNRGIWQKLETLVRNWVKAGKDLYVVTGTVYGARYNTIGKDGIGIPMAMWKVIMDRNTNKTIGFMIPNAALMQSDLPKYAVPVSVIEKATGINFFPTLPPELLSEKNAAPKLEVWPCL
ncbi:MAG: DNA/RNA non-specific endonuclease [Chlorobiaceae bacterium]